MGQRIKEWAERWLASSSPPEAHLAAHLYATQWMRVGWPPWMAADAMFVGLAQRRPATSHRHQVGCWRPEQLKWKDMRHRGRSGDKK